MPNELAGRTTRTLGFRVREALPSETESDDPRAHVLGITRGFATDLTKLTERDLKALHEVLGELFAGNPLPIER